MDGNREGGAKTFLTFRFSTKCREIGKHGEDFPTFRASTNSREIRKAGRRLCNRPKTGDIYRNMTETKKDFKYSLRQCRKNAEMHKANGLAAALTG